VQVFQNFSSGGLVFTDISASVEQSISPDEGHTQALYVVIVCLTQTSNPSAEISSFIQNLQPYGSLVTLNGVDMCITLFFIRTSKFWVEVRCS